MDAITGFCFGLMIGLAIPMVVIVTANAVVNIWKNWCDGEDDDA